MRANTLKWRALVLGGAVLATSWRARGAEVFESPADEAPRASLSATQAAGRFFHVEDPVRSDGLMHRYVIESRFGVFQAYGADALKTRLKEVAALTAIDETSDGKVVLESAVRGVQGQAKAVVRVASHPVGTLLGIPVGIGHLLGGYRAEAEEVRTEMTETLSPHQASGGTTSRGGALPRAGAAAEHAARSEADRYIGLSAAERRLYAKLGVDPYTDNEVLRRAVTRLARIDAAASLGMRFAPVGIPFAGEVQRALEQIDHEDPAVLRKRRRESLLRAGLGAAEAERFEHAVLLTPTRQTLLVEAVHSLDGTDGRTELLRHAMSLQSEEEMEVFLQSTLCLLRFHAHRPITRIMAGVRIPAAELPDGRIAVFGAFDAVQWTAEVAGYERNLRAALPQRVARELWITGSVSPLARAALERRGWAVHAEADFAAEKATATL
jgi:hypothetical protein